MENQESPQKAIATNCTKAAKKEFDRLHNKLRRAGKKAVKGDVPQLRQLLAQNPGLLQVDWTINKILRTEMIDEVAGDGTSKAIMLAEVDRWINDLGYEDAPALERIHMDTIVTCRLRLAFLEMRQNAAQKSGSVSLVEHNDRMLNSTNHRLNKAIESLARIRVLATRAPVFQVNVATNGGQQVNLA